MKIIVDEMPKEPRDCPYSKTRQVIKPGALSLIEEGIGCIKKRCIDDECNNVNECPFFVGINEIQ